MTIVELLVALTIFGVVVTGAVAFAARQNSAFQESLVRLGALRNLRYALATLEQDLQTLGTNVPISQPRLFYGDADVVVFSADYASNLAGDPFAVFYDPDAPAGQVSAPTVPIVVPTTSVTIADSAYQVAGVNSPAEVIAFYFQPDTATARSDDFALYRRVNAGQPEMLARHLLRVGSAPFFAYLRERQTTTGDPLVEVAAADLPIRHRTTYHLAVADTGRSAWADSVRAIRVTLAATNGLSGTEERRVEASRLVALPNAGAAVLSTCGSVPLLGTTITAVAGTSSAGNPIVTLTWGRATDEVGGESDVVRYVLWKQDLSQPGWGDPFVAIPAGAPSYTYEDATVESGRIYQFALAAQDCTPSLSARAISSPVAVP